MGMSAEERMAIGLDAQKIWGQTDDEEFNRKVARRFRDSAFRSEDFAGRPYPREEVAADLKKIDEIKKSPGYIREKSNESVALEYVLMRGVKDDDWFGGKVKSVRKASEYDDIMNGVDFIVTFHDEDTDKFVHLAIDATTSSDTSVLRRKAERVFEKLNQAKLTELKYFEDLDGNKGKTEMPRIVLSLGSEKTLALQKLMASHPGWARDAREKYDFLVSAKEQLLDFINYILLRVRLLGEGRELKDSDHVFKFMAEHDEDMGGRIGQIVRKHAEVLRFIEGAEKRKDPPVS